MSQCSRKKPLIGILSFVFMRIFKEYSIFNDVNKLREIW